MEHFVKGQRVKVIKDTVLPKSKLNDFIGQTGTVTSAYYAPNGYDNTIRVKLDSLDATTDNREGVRVFYVVELEPLKEV